MKTLSIMGAFIICITASAMAQPRAASSNPNIWYQTAGTATGASTAFNPAISVNGLFLGFYTADPLARHPFFEEEHHHEGEDILEGDAEEAHAEEEGHAHAHGLPENSGMSVQEVEVRFTSVVDAYFRADLTLAIPGTEGLEVETAQITTTQLPNIAIHIGKFYGAFGKHNGLHTHAYPFIDPPIVHERLFGGEGLNEVGIGASVLLPASWYSEITAQILNGSNELFNSPDGGDMAYLGHFKNLWDLTDNTTLELGASCAFGKNAYTQYTHVFGGDLTYKWRPARRMRDRGLILQAEYLQARLNDGADTEKAGGLYALAQYQFTRTWWIQTRYDVFGIPNPTTDREHRLSALLALAPSEFSALRLQYNHNRQAGQTTHQLALQFNFTLGAHPAHAY